MKRNNLDTYKKIRPLMAYFKENGTLKDIKQKTEYDYNGKNVKIGWLVQGLRRDLKNEKISDELKEILDYMEFDWNKNSVFDNNKKYLMAWYIENKTLSNMTQYSTMQYGDEIIPIGDVLGELRKLKKNDELSDAQVEFLDMCDIVWAPKDTETAYSSLMAYYDEFGSLSGIKMKDTYEYDGKTYNIGRQINHLRERYNKGKLDKDEIEFFESRGMDWGERRNIEKETSQEKEV